MEHSWIFSTPRLCLLAIIFIAGSAIQVEAGPPRCPPLCEGDECPPPPICTYGTYIDNCGRTLCARGPGNSCGDQRGMFRSMGSCGRGLTCRCGRCQGCSLDTMDECYSRTCIQSDK